MDGLWELNNDVQVIENRIINSKINPEYFQYVFSMLEI